MTDPRTDTSCPRCHGWRWVCEEHPLAAWDEGCEIVGCDGAGAPCEVCNPDAEMPPGFTVIAEVPRD